MMQNVVALYIMTNESNNLKSSVVRIVQNLSLISRVQVYSGWGPGCPESGSRFKRVGPGSRGPVWVWSRFVGAGSRWIISYVNFGQSLSRSKPKNPIQPPLGPS
jgi:hypothetical protein